MVGDDPVDLSNDILYRSPGRSGDATDEISQGILRGEYIGCGFEPERYRDRREIKERSDEVLPRFQD